MNGEELIATLPAEVPEQQGEIVAAFPETGVMQPVSPGEPLELDDLFPPIDLSKEEKEKLCQVFTRNLKQCILNVRKHVDTWRRWEEIYSLEKAYALYSEVGAQANFPSGLICEKVIEAMDRLLRAVYKPDPMFAIHEKRSDVEDIESILRIEHWMDSYCRDELHLEKRFGKKAFARFLLFGSLIVECDNMYRIVPQRTVKTIRSIEELQEYTQYSEDMTQFSELTERLMSGGSVRLIVEQENLQERGLNLFLVDLEDHLVPPGVFDDEDIRFRARRVYYTETDLKLLASDAVGWYKPEDVNKVLGQRVHDLGFISNNKAVPRMEEMRSDAGIAPGYEWLSESYQWGDKRELPYKDVFIIFRIFAKYTYRTKKDPEGLVPKWTVWDFDPVSNTILRARTYPHLDERLPWIHFKLGVSLRSYYAYGFAALLEHEDSRQTSLLNLYMESAAMSTYPPYLCADPDEGGIVPFRLGMGPGQVGFVRNPQADFRQLDLRAPADGLMRWLWPISGTLASNRTSITPYSLGQTESTDPRSPARKTELLLGQAQLGIESIIADWNIGWEQLAEHIWKSVGENAAIRGSEKIAGVVQDIEGQDGSAKVTAEELQKEIKWVSQASAGVVNPQARKTDFLQKFSFYIPLIQRLWQVNPEVGMRYFIRWLRHSASELELRGAKYLIPTEQEIAGMSPESAQALMTEMQEWMRAGGREGESPQPVREVPTEEQPRV